MFSTSNSRPSTSRHLSDILRFLVGAILIPSSIWMPSIATADIVFGTSARSDFENFRDTLGDTHQDFGGLSVGTNLTSQLFGLQFNTVKDLNNNPLTPHHTEIMAGSLVMGARSASSGADGRYPFQVVFDTPQRRAGLRRPWNTFSNTAFYNSADELLGQHQNSVNDEFVGYLENSDDTSTWVKRIEFNGTLSGGSRQVGQFGDLFYGTVSAVPEPASMVILSLGFVIGTLRRTRRI